MAYKNGKWDEPANPANPAGRGTVNKMAETLDAYAVKTLGVDGTCRFALHSPTARAIFGSEDKAVEFAKELRRHDVQCVVVRVCVTIQEM